MGILDQVDWSGVEIDSGMDNAALPPGEYTVEAWSYKEEVSAAGNTYLHFEFKVLGPTHVNQRIWENFTLTGSSTVGMARLKSFISVTGIDVNQPLGYALVNSAMNRPLNVTTRIEEGIEYADKTQITSFKEAKNMAQAQAPVAPAAQAPVETVPAPVAAPAAPTVSTPVYTVTAPVVAPPPVTGQWTT